MSSQKGNMSRSRPQKYQNQFAFKNNLHDKSHKTKTINNLQVANVCERCKKIIEWKIKYKKYKPLKAPGKCNKCDQKTIKHAYHTMCGPCARERNVCPKCGNEAELVESQPTKTEQLKLDAEMQTMLKSLPERKRRTFIRYLNKQNKEREQKSLNDAEEDKKKTPAEEETTECVRDHLLTKLKSMMIEEDDDDDDDFEGLSSNDNSDFTDDE